MNYETFGKSRVNEDDLEYLVSTNEVRTYLQNKVDRICDTIKANGGEHLKVTVSLTSEKFGKSFVPFLIALPGCVEDRATSNSNIPESLRPNDEDDGVRLKKPFYQLFANYCYDNNDRKALSGQGIIKNLGLYRGANREIQSLIKPKKENFGESTYILFLLDPIRLFRDYLRDRNNPGEKFDPLVVRCQKISDEGDFEYSVKKKKKKQDPFKRKDLHKRMARSIQRSKD